MHPKSPPSFSVPPQSAPRWTAFAAVGLANVALAFGPLFVRLADVGPVAAAFWRLSLATPVLFAVAWMLGGTPFRSARGLWGAIVVAALAFAADLASWHIGIVRTTLANATLFGNSATLIYPIYGFIAARMWPNRPQAAALLLAAIGAAMLLGRSAELSTRNLVGDLFCLFAGCCYAVYFIFMARARTRLAPVSALALCSLVTLAPLLLLSVALGERILPGNWGPLVALAVGSQLIGQGLMIYALGALSPLVVGIALLIQPIVAAALGWWLFEEALAPADMIGALLVAAALVLVRRGARAPLPLAPTGAAIRPDA